MAPEIKFTSFGIPYLVEFADVVFLSNRSRGDALPRSASVPTLSSRAYPTLLRSSTTKSSSKRSRIADLFLLSKKNRRRGNGSSTHHSSRASRHFDTHGEIPPSVSEKCRPVRSCSPIPIPLKTFAAPCPSTTSLPSSSCHSHTTTSSDWSIPPALPPPVITPSMAPDRSFYADGLYIKSDEHDAQPRSARGVAELRRRIADALREAGMDASGPAHENGCDNSGELAAQLSRGDYAEFKAALRTLGLTYEKCMETRALADGRSCVAMLDRNERGEWGDEASLRVCQATRLGAMFVTKTHEHGRVELRKFTVWA